MNTIASATLIAACLLSTGQAHSQVIETSLATNKLIGIVSKTDEVLFGRISSFLQEFKNIPRGVDANVLNELEIFLSEKGFEDIQSFCFFSGQKTVSGILISGKFRVISIGNNLKIESI